MECNNNLIKQILTEDIQLFFGKNGKIIKKLTSQKRYFLTAVHGRTQECVTGIPLVYLIRTTVSPIIITHYNIEHVLNDGRKRRPPQVPLPWIYADKPPKSHHSACLPCSWGPRTFDVAIWLPRPACTRSTRIARNVPCALTVWSRLGKCNRCRPAPWWWCRSPPSPRQSCCSPWSSGTRRKWCSAYPSARHDNMWVT